MKVLVSDKVSEAGIKILEDKGVDVTYNIDLSYDELLRKSENIMGLC